MPREGLESKFSARQGDLVGDVEVHVPSAPLLQGEHLAATGCKAESHTLEAPGAGGIPGGKEGLGKVRLDLRKGELEGGGLG
ncbi:MAG: hypothetical protein RLZZ142_1281 [Verrucomicrobiota bacterium]|jgi:hypothetical protein